MGFGVDKIRSGRTQNEVSCVSKGMKMTGDVECVFERQREFW